jgi:tartrate-resistant acid phosphatase type 5
MSHDAVTRRDAIQGLGGLGLAAALPASRAASDGRGSLSFLAVGDWGREGAYHQRDVAIQMARSARELDARFVVSVGDNFYENGVTGVDDPAWRRSFEDIYDAPSLQIPWHVALGNHDYRGNVQAQIDYTEHSPRWRLPARWYSFEERAPDGAVAELFVTDTTPLVAFYYADPLTREGLEGQRRNVPLQLAWLDRALARSSAQWKIVIGHHPVYSGWIDPGRALSRANPYFVLRTLGGTPDLMARLDPILRRHRVALYLNGHNHDLQHVRMGSTDFVCTGAGSKIGDFCDLGGAEFCALRSGFVACSIDRERLRVVYRDYEGTQLHVTDVRAAV